MRKLTKIVATIGPATETETILADMIKAGMNVARFNTKHADPDWHNERIERVKRVAQEQQQPIAVLLDLQGPEVRINLVDGKSFTVDAGERIVFTANEHLSQEKKVLIPQEVIDSLSVDNILLLADGSCEFVVIRKEHEYLEVEAVHACEVQHRKTLNTPGVVLDMPSLTDRDYQYLDGVNPTFIDFVGLSFVRNVEDIAILRQELDKRNIHAGIISKIENQSALDNLDEIIYASDAIMVARGDLGVEVPFQELAYWQKQMINKCRIAAKPVITATQMLQSMVTNPRPSRAEVTDIANAIYDGTDAVMLSEETTIGKYPVKAIATQASIAEFNEPHRSHVLLDTIPSSIPMSIARAAIDMIEHSTLNVDSIVCLTHSGQTAHLLSRFRPSIPVHAVTDQEKVYRQLALSYGVTPHLVSDKFNSTIESETTIDLCKAEGIIHSGETVLLVQSTFRKEPRQTNALMLVKVS